MHKKEDQQPSKDHAVSKILETQDGSHTVISNHFGAAYHSKFGAIQESKHVFLQAGLLPFLKIKNTISILEMGFGTGLNALMTFLEVQNLSTIVDYVSLEAYPLKMEEIHPLNYSELLGISADILHQMHACAWGKKIGISKDFSLTKHHTLFQDFQTNTTFDLIYYDAFAPEAQPELWDTPLLRKMFELLAPNGVLVTYCAKGYVKRNLKAVGFTVESIPGPPGKREMTRAIKYLPND